MYGKSTRYLSNEEFQTQGFKRVGFNICEETFTCQENLEEHIEPDHELNAFLNCNMCSKM